MFNTLKQWGKTITAALAVGVLTAGCIAIGGSDRYESKNPTIGRQLQDLKTARDTGALSPQEYEQTKAKLLADGH